MTVQACLQTQLRDCWTYARAVERVVYKAQRASIALTIGTPFSGHVSAFDPRTLAFAIVGAR
jgi:hypothetical protein